MIRKIINLFYKIVDKYISPERRAVILKKRGILRCGGNCTIFENVGFGSEPYLITLGSNVRVTSGVRFITHDGGIHVLRNKYNIEKADKFGTIDIGNNVFIGINSIILPNVTIGDNVVIGAGSIVTESIPSDSVVCGIPAKKIKNIDLYYEESLKDLDLIKTMNREKKEKYLLKKFYNIDK